MESTFWSDEERAAAKEHGVHILISNTSPQDIIDDDSNLPSDTHIVTYIVPVEHDGMSGEKIVYDAVRAAKKVDIFDIYYDRLKPFNATIKSIESGYGKVRPNLWGANQKKDSK